MSNLRDIRIKIGVVQNLQKLTHAMEMVTRSKIARTKECMEATRPFSNQVRVIAAHMSHAHLEYHSPYLKVRSPVRRIGLLLVTTDKGLCGGLNSRILRLVMQRMKSWSSQDIELRVCALGNKGLGFMKRAGVPVLSQAVGLGDFPHLEQLIAPISGLLKEYREGRLDQVVMAYTRFENMLVQEPIIEPLLPLGGERLGAPEGHWDYIYEPDAGRVVEGILRRYLETLIYLVVAENMVSEQAARIMSMKAACDNAKETIASQSDISPYASGGNYSGTDRNCFRG